VPVTVPDHYRTLGLDRTADADAIKQAYHELAKREHPDAGGSEDRMQQLNAAHKALSDPVARRQYDAETHPQAHLQPQTHAAPPASPQSATTPGQVQLREFSKGIFELELRGR
jgi:curved DNA-binding protein CbpA